MSDVSEFIKNEVYPLIDAVSAGWLDHLNPKRSHGHAYSLDCPNCEKPQRAYYYPGSPYVSCNRRNECAGKIQSKTIWDILAGQGNSNRDIFNKLCSEANVTPPQQKNTNSPNAKVTFPAGKAIMQVTRQLAKDNSNIMGAFARERKFTEANMKEMNLGYYPSADIVMRELKALGADLAECIELGFLPSSTSGYDAFKGRIVGYWKQPDLSLRLWGRSPSKDNPEHTKKYQFTLSQSKTYPYLLESYSDGPVVAVEGVFDAWSVRFAGKSRGIAVGGNTINGAQAHFLSKAGINDLIHMIDPDNAGLQGALSSIRNGAEFGIRVNVAVLPRNTGDPDELRCARRLEVITTAIEKAFSPGEFLARFYVRESEKGNAYNCRLAINTYRAMLVPDRIQFTSMCADLGVEVMPELDAVKAMGNLMDSGATILEAAAFIKRKFKVAITVESVNE